MYTTNIKITVVLSYVLVIFSQTNIEMRTIMQKKNGEFNESIFEKKKNENLGDSEII